MSTLLALWKLNRISIRRRAIIYEYVGYAKSESQPQQVYHVVTRIAVTPDFKLQLASFTCECKGFLYGMLCKHVKSLYNAAARDIRARLRYDFPITGGDVA
jgi:hypothetical protein